MDRHLHNAMMAQYATPKVSGDGLVSWDKGVKCVMPSVKLYGAAVQDGTPTPDAPIMPVCNDGVFKATGPDGAYDGGKAAAPELWAITGTDIRDEWDAQTGKGIRRVKKLVLTPDLKWYIYDKTGVTENNFAYLTGFINTISSKLGMFSHGTYSAVEITVSDISAYMYASGIFRIRTGHESTLADFKAFLQEQIDAGTPVTVCYTLKEPEPFYHPPTRLTQPHGPGQIIQVSGSVPDCPIEANYLTHS